MSKKLGISLIAITISLMVTISIAVSYAMWTVTNEQEESNIVQSGCFSMELTSETNVINLNNAYPILDEEADALIPYTITITNTCTIASSYNINLEILNGTTLNTSYVATKVDGEAIRKLNALPAGEIQIENSLESKTIISGRLAPTKSKTYNIRLWMDKDVTLSSDAENKILKGKLVIESVVAQPICKRATTLHTETCGLYTGGGCTAFGYEEGDTITYGNEEITNGELNVGDAFTCDVNGDGIYDEQTERFYYVSDYYDTINSTETNSIFDTNTAVLIYYSNITKSGNVVVPSNVTPIPYVSSNINYNGPASIYTYLPLTTDWTTVSLKENQRQIRTEIGGTKALEHDLPIFNYTNYAARLLTYQEAVRACGTNISEVNPKCRFMVENTIFALDNDMFAHWLETPNSSSITDVYGIYTPGTINLYPAGMYGRRGLRPVIDVPKTDIKY